MEKDFFDLMRVSYDETAPNPPLEPMARFRKMIVFSNGPRAFYCARGRLITMEE